MPNYQPHQGLTWRYTAGTGQLSIVAKIFVDVAAGEQISTAASLRNDKGAITLSLNGAETPPLTKIINVDIISTNLTKDQVRGIIGTLTAKTIITTFYKLNRIEGEAINTTSQNSDIEII